MYKYHKYYILLLCFFSVNVYSQSDYYSYTLKNFRRSEQFNEEIDLKNPDLARLHAVIFFLTNEQRKKRKLSELEYHPKLEESSLVHSNSMVKDDFFSHYNPKSKKLYDPNDRARYVGIANPFLAENIVESFALRYTAGDDIYPLGKGVFSYKQNGDLIQTHSYLSLGESMIKSWMNSPPHRDNILSKKAVQLGCGTAFFLKEDFNEMPAVIATQNFQFYEPVRVPE